MDNYARAVQILVSLSGGVEQQITNINKLLDQLAGRKIDIGTSPSNSIEKLASGAQLASNNVKKISDATNDVEKKSVSNFDTIKRSMEDMQYGISNLTSSFIGLAAGAALVGLSWRQSADFALYNEQINRAIDNNKKLGISSQELTKFVKEQAAAGEGTKQDTSKKLYAVLMAGTKYFKGTSQEKLEQADAITDFWFANQEIMKEKGFGSPEELILRTVRSTGKMSGLFAENMAAAMGVSSSGKEMASAKSRIKYMVETGSNPEIVNMQEELAKRPWEQFEVSLNKLKNSIGDSLIVPMSIFIRSLTSVLDLIRAIPGAPGLIAFSGIILAAVSAIGLLSSVIGPGIVALRSLHAMMTLNNLTTAQNILLNKALIVTDWLGITSKAARTTATVAEATATAGLTGAIGMEIVALEADAIATTTAATATTGLAAAEWAALSPLLLIAIPLVALAGLLYLVETRTHVFSNALKQLSETQLSKDIAKWFQDVGYWAGYAIDRFGFVIGSDLTNSIKTLDTAYSSIKSITSGDFLKSPIDLILNTKTESVSKSSSESVFGPMSLIIRAGFPTIQKYLEIISNNITTVRNLFDSSIGTISRIYNSIVNLPQNIWKFITEGLESLINNIRTKFSETVESISSMLPLDDLNTTINNLKTNIETFRTTISTSIDNFKTNLSTSIDNFKTNIETFITNLKDNITTSISDLSTTLSTTINNLKEGLTSAIENFITSIKEKLPSWLGGGEQGSSQSMGPLSEQEVINIIKGMKYDDGSKKFKFSDKIYQIAYQEAVTGIPQDYLNADPGKYNKMVSKIEDIIAKPEKYQTNITNNNINNISDNRSPHEIEVAKASGDINYDASKNLGKSFGLIEGEGFSAEESKAIESNLKWANEGYAKGGFVEKSGLALVHSGEPIIPAEVASSSRLQSILENIAFGSEISTTNHGDINVNINYTAPVNSSPSNMIVMDKISFEHMVCDIVAKKLRQLNGY